MLCPRCGSSNFEIVPITEGEIKKRGCLGTLVYLILIVITGGIALIIALIRSGSKGKIKTKTIGVCRNCGKKFNI